MKVIPHKLVSGQGYIPCPTENATHIKIKIPGPSPELYLPFILKGKREGTGAWTWNGDMERPTLKPSILTNGGTYNTNNEYIKYTCHTWVSDGRAIFLDDCTHEFKGQILELVDLE